MKFYPLPPEKNPKPCAKCRRGARIFGKLCGFCYAATVTLFEKRSRKSRIVLH